MDNLCERVARAMIADHYGRISAGAEVYDYATGETVIEEIRNRFEGHAQAAIAAILQEYPIVPREPTEAMIDAVYKRADGQAATYCCPEDTWEAMIAAAPKLESE